MPHKKKIKYRKTRRGIDAMLKSCKPSKEKLNLPSLFKSFYALKKAREKRKMAGIINRITSVY